MLAGPIGQPVRFAAPVRIRRKLHEPRLAHAGQRQRRREHVGQESLRAARQILRFGAPCRRDAAGRREQHPPIRIADQAEHQIAIGIEVVDHEQQLAEARLAEILGEQLRVAAAQVVGLRQS